MEIEDLKVFTKIINRLQGSDPGTVYAVSCKNRIFSRQTSKYYCNEKLECSSDEIILIDSFTIERRGFFMEELVGGWELFNTIEDAQAYIKNTKLTHDQ